MQDSEHEVKFRRREKQTEFLRNRNSIQKKYYFDKGYMKWWIHSYKYKKNEKTGK